MNYTPFRINILQVLFTKPIFKANKRKYDYSNEFKKLRTLLIHKSDYRVEVNKSLEKFVIANGLAGLGNWKNPLLNKIKKELLVRDILLRGQINKLIKLLYRHNVKIIPIKGASLIYTYYNQDQIRFFGDIDIFIAPEKVTEMLEIIKASGYHTKHITLIQSTLKYKSKFDLINDNSKMLPIDVHTSLINKKFFSYNKGIFSSEILSRTQVIAMENTEVMRLNPIDEWLYLAQHFVLHHKMSGIKWLYDLYIIQSKFSNQDLSILVWRAKRYQLKKVIIAVREHLLNLFGHENIKIPKFMDKYNSLFLMHLIKKTLSQKAIFEGRYNDGNRKPLDGLLYMYWEIILIDEIKEQLIAVFRMVFPPKGLFYSIYKIKHLLFYIMLLPIHMLLSLLYIAFINFYLLICSPFVVQK
ncbi:MAG: nucleotidyltransferase family protein [Bacteroidota bacterium]